MSLDKDTQFRRGRHRRSKLLRPGSLIIEAVVAVTLLATATYALARLASSSAALGLQSNQRLAATLAAENTIERLRGLPLERLLDQADSVAQLVSEASACEVEVSTEPFSHRTGDGIHVRVDVSPSKNIRVSLHDWRLDTVPADQTDQSNASDDSTSQTSEVDDA